MNKVKAAFLIISKWIINIWKWLFSWGATPYLLLAALIFLFLATKWDDTHDEIRSSLIVELLGALIILASVDALQSWRTKRAQRHEAMYRLYMAYQLIYPHGRKYIEAINEVTSNNFPNRPPRDLSKIDFTDLGFFFNPNYYSDAPKGALVYHLYFNSLFKVLDEVRQAVSSLNPAHHFELMELYREFLQRNEQAYRLYNYFKSVEDKPGHIEHFYQELLKFKKGIIKDDVNALASKVSDLNPFAKLYLLTLYNIDILVKQAGLVQDKLKDFRDSKADVLKFNFD